MGAHLGWFEEIDRLDDVCLVSWGQEPHRRLGQSIGHEFLARLYITQRERVRIVGMCVCVREREREREGGREREREGEREGERERESCSPEDSQWHW